MKLQAEFVEKPWGRTNLPPPFDALTQERRIGEIWFGAPDGVQLPLLAKYICTAEALSVQVHPNDQQGRERGLPGGKSECWYIVAAEPGAVLGLGLKAPVARRRLEAAALDGSIEKLMRWVPVRPGDFFYVPAGTIHAIGAGISLIELQQNVDVTYRLYDYGRPRELHLEDALAVANADIYPQHLVTRSAAGSAVLLGGPIFTVVKGRGLEAEVEELRSRMRWVLPLEGSACAGTEAAGPGECLLLEPGARLEVAEETVLLIGAVGSCVRSDQPLAR